MRNSFLDPRTARDIDTVVTKILNGLRNPKPLLKLDDVRALQQLDRQYYSSVDDGALREFVSKAYLGAKQVFLRPTLILDIVRKRSLKALYLPDRKRILVDSSEPELKWRWNEAHEIIHAGVPWHQEAMFGDTEVTLSPTCHEQIEAQDNFGAPLGDPNYLVSGRIGPGNTRGRNFAFIGRRTNPASTSLGERMACYR